MNPATPVTKTLVIVRPKSANLGSLSKYERSDAAPVVLSGKTKDSRIHASQNAAPQSDFSASGPELVTGLPESMVMTRVSRVASR